MRKFDNTIEFDARKFSWEIGTGVTCASDLGIRPIQTPFVRVYKDSGDLGLTLVNPLRKTKCDFVLTEEKVFDGGDIIAWKFKSVNQKPGATNISLTIFND